MKLVGDDYLLQKKLSQGPCGAVWRALDQKRGQLVTVRFLPEAVQTNAEAMDRFRRQFPDVLAFRHPNVVTPERFVDDSTNGSFWVARFVDGPLLDEYALQWTQTEGRFPPQLIFDTLRPVASALDEAAQRNLAHRSLSPRSVVVSPTEGVLILDFELSGIVRESLNMASLIDEAELLRFLAPEQIGSRKVFFSTDQYALGAMAYELFGGSFLGMNAALLPLPGQPEHVNQSFQRAMHRDPTARFPSCQDFLDSLTDVTLAQNVTSVPIPAEPLLSEPSLEAVTSFETIAAIASETKATSVAKRIQQERRFQRLFHLWNITILVVVLVVAFLYRERLLTAWNQRVAQQTTENSEPSDDNTKGNIQETVPQASNLKFQNSPRQTRTPRPPKEVEFNGPEESPFNIEGISIANTPDEVRFVRMPGIGKRIVFVVDASAVMGGGKQTPLSHARKELDFSFQELNDSQRFQVIYFDEEANMLPSDDADQMIAVSPSNLKRSHTFLETIQGNGCGDPAGALLKAISLKPDLIFFLSDENAVQLTVDQIEQVKRVSGNIPIHGAEIGSGMEPDEPTVIKSLTTACRGRFQWVNASLHSLDRLKKQ